MVPKHKKAHTSRATTTKIALVQCITGYLRLISVLQSYSMMCGNALHKQFRQSASKIYTQQNLRLFFFFFDQTSLTDLKCT